jgi:hypothetical protein
MALHYTSESRMVTFKHVIALHRIIGILTVHAKDTEEASQTSRNQQKSHFLKAPWKMFSLCVPHVQRGTYYRYAHSGKENLKRMVAFACEPRQHNRKLKETCHSPLLPSISSTRVVTFIKVPKSWAARTRARPLFFAQNKCSLPWTLGGGAGEREASLRTRRAGKPSASR